MRVGKDYCVQHAVTVNAYQADHNEFGTASLKTDHPSVFEEVEY